ncbi:MAG: Unknown protein [uncultured Campylobacterales bacterium]|uniref:DUF3575 domain-containing protein n=1 Tax=uncultured Campylobacterales bacterium TaxID=352960 RepID=A0A6S6SRW7_9BACT|nr:MAG: Unknown protein [uncultured Campylobacterales bacterium]
MKTIFLMCVCSFVLLSRPVSYPGGTTVMIQNDSKQNRIHIHYSPTQKYSIGIYDEYVRDLKSHNIGLQYNRLLNRKNSKLTQRNFYLKSKLGYLEDDIFGALGLAFDWESRKYFISYENEVNVNGSSKEFIQKARVGIAPYVAKYGFLHTWIMLEIENEAKAEDNILVSPILRLFKGDYLAELGLKNKNIIFNLIVRF